MIKYLTIYSSTTEIKYWQDLGFTVVFIVR